MYMSFGLDFFTWSNFKSMIMFVLDFVILRILAYWDTENFGEVLEQSGLSGKEVGSLD